MNCGCNTIFPSAQCVNTQQPAGTYPCKYHYPSLKGNMVIPAANVTVDVRVTSTVNMYVGQGISIGDHKFQIVEIVDGENIVLKHDGQATPNNTLIAIHPVYACYQYPIVPVGKVSLLSNPSLIGLDASFAAVTAFSPTVNVLHYGYLGPKHIQFEAEVITDVADTPHWLGVSLPIAPAGINPLPAFSGVLDYGAGLISGPSLLAGGLFTDYAIIGRGGGATLPDNTGSRFLISGTYEV